MMFCKKRVDPHSVDAREENIKNKEEELKEKEEKLASLTRQLEGKDAFFQIEKDIFDRKVNNWKIVDDARRDNYKQQMALGIEVAKLEARRDALKENDILRNQLFTTKDDQNTTLKTLLTEAIKALQQHPMEVSNE